MLKITDIELKKLSELLKKEKDGIYIWLAEPNKNMVFDEANFEAFVGEFDDDMYRKGTYLIKEGDDYYLYHGLFDREGRKSDDNAYFYLATSYPKRQVIKIS